MSTPRERAILATPLPSGRAGVLAPFQFVFTGEDRLRLSTLNTVVGVGVRVSWRLLVDGQASSVANADTFQPKNTAAIEEVHEIEVGRGALSNLVVRATDRIVEAGALFVRVDVIRGSGAAAIVLGTLLSGYVGSWGGRAWPGSPLEQPTEGPGQVLTLTGSVPAVGVDPVLITALQGERRRLIAAQAVLTTSAVAGARTPLLRLFPGLVVFDGQSSLNQGPGVVARHTWGAGVTTPPGSGTFMGQGPIPVDCVMSSASGSTELRILTVGIDAGDQWSALTLFYERWLNPITTATP